MVNNSLPVFPVVAMIAISLLTNLSISFKILYLDGDWFFFKMSYNHIVRQFLLLKMVYLLGENKNKTDYI